MCLKQPGPVPVQNAPERASITHSKVNPGVKSIIWRYIFHVDKVINPKNTTFYDVCVTIEQS